ncbi:MAG: DegT/DnrJ/EryC1/StrS family aminotransferase [Candidatus Heimdallarchaeum aukensis]|uniref:DegT/DnrJ/EryC1/StrS family aminotransferase n=1 Tax=Candidatus Heimdallarchaeum aukensis TaxID=2876573 RepID=A0A9Y1BM84_9ARCH|nr:MAG: DegT/DnrJ/EryC1/StrS family aminotransferase [Candidatus Heimdallarchaeum aukensis]
MKLETALNEIKNIVDMYFSENDIYKDETKIRLIAPSYGTKEVIEVIESLLSTNVTMGKKVSEFENMFSTYLNVKYGTMVNSGSSANLIALQILSNPAIRNNIKPKDEIITPALTWSTTVFPMFDIHAVPVFVDVDPKTLTIDVNQLKSALSKKTKAIMPVHLLGHPCDMDYITEFAEDNSLYIIEDCCEAHGAMWKGKKVGSFGDIGTFSFFFSHHISTIEGGIVVTNNEEYNLLSKSLRAHGWIRERKDRSILAKKYPFISEKYLFINKGYNLRPTELQGAFGIHQIKKLDDFIKIREENAKYWLSELDEIKHLIQLPTIKKDVKHSWFGFPLIVKDEAPFKKDDLIQYLELNNIETRPIMSGNITEHPALKYFKWRKIGNLEVSSKVMKNGFFFGNHLGIKNYEREFIAEKIREFIDYKT